MSDQPLMVFVGGLQRSGTTVISRALAANPHAAGLVGTGTPEDEGQFVQDVFLDDHEMGRQMQRELLGRGGRVIRWAYHPSAHLTEADVFDAQTTWARLSAAWAPYWSNPNAAYRIEKSPSNLMRTRYLQALFPASRFVIVTRHPIIQALAVRKWSGRRAQLGFGILRAIDHWLRAMEAFACDAALLDHVLVVRYEDFVNRPTQTYRSIVRFCGMPDADVDLSRIHDANQPYAAYWRSALTEVAPSKVTLHPNSSESSAMRYWEASIRALYIRQFVGRKIEAYAPKFAQFGYGLSPRERGWTPAADRLAAYRRIYD